MELRHDGMNILRAQLGLVESERFLTLIKRESFDYTQWRQDQWKNATVAELAEQARNLRKNDDQD